MNQKTLIVAGACLLCGVIAQAQLPATLTTTDGHTYNGVSVIRAEPDGYLVNYAPTPNGMGIAKIKFSRLSADMQKEAGYDATKARDFETKVAQNNESWRQDIIHFEQTARTEQAARQARDDQEEQLSIARISALAELRHAEADLARAGVEPTADNNNNNYGSGYGWSLGGGLDSVAIPEIERNQFDHDGHKLNSFDARFRFHQPFPQLPTPGARIPAPFGANPGRLH